MLASRRANCVRSFQFIEAPTDVYYIYFLLLCVCVLLLMLDMVLLLLSGVIAVMIYAGLAL